MRYIYITAKSKDKQYFKETYPLTQEQIDFFHKYETNHEIGVRRNALKLSKKFPDIATKLMKAVTKHDASKWGATENWAYIWRYSNNNYGIEYPAEELEDYVRKIVARHASINRHHPEYWEKKGGLDKMPPYELAHMVCDWGSVSKAVDDNLHNWWRYRASRRWKFTDEQKKLIKQYVDCLESNG